MKYRKALIVLLVIELLCVGLIIGLKIYSDKKTGTQKPNLEIDKALANANDKTGIKPWGEQLEDSPITDLPDNNHLIGIYKTIINSAQTRDYEQFKNNISKELLWKIENKMAVERATVKDYIVSYTKRDGKEYFLKNGLAEMMLFSAPVLGSIQVTHAEIINNSEEHVDQVIYYNKDTNEKYILPSPKTNVVLIECKGNLSDDKETDGNMSFTFEDNSWKYLSSYWNIKGPDMGVTVGDIFPPDKTITIPEKHETLVIPTIEIEEGQVILWYNFSGYIYSVDPTPEIWNSPYLSFAHFSKKFNNKGEFNYIVYDEQNNAFLEGKIIVK